jgi:GNAT superfamily N-acetyltransferase
VSPESAEIVCRFPCERDLEAEAIRKLAELINRVYDEAESGMWKAQGTRTTAGQIEELLRAGALILAEYRGAVVGSVNVNLLEAGVAEFGMLVADPVHRNKGIGTALVEAAEDWARKMKCEVMRLELLTPRTWRHPSKEFLKEWYGRMGYRPQFTEPLEGLHPDKVAQLATDCDFTVWHKRL